MHESIENKKIHKKTVKKLQESWAGDNFLKKLGALFLCCLGLAALMILKM